MPLARPIALAEPTSRPSFLARTSSNSSTADQLTIFLQTPCIKDGAKKKSEVDGSLLTDPYVWNNRPLVITWNNLWHHKFRLLSETKQREYEGASQANQQEKEDRLPATAITEHSHHVLPYSCTDCSSSIDDASHGGNGPLSVEAGMFPQVHRHS